MSKTRDEVVKEFHQAFSQPVREEPSTKLLQARKNFIEEEVKELFAEIDAATEKLQKGEAVPRELYVNMLKELADVQYVLSGTAVALRPLEKLEEAFIRVHKSNLSKLGVDGKPVLREDGKVLKGPHYAPPDLSDLV